MLTHATFKQASSNTYESDAATYDASDDKVLDEKLDEIAETTLTNCGQDFHAYINKHNAVVEALLSMNLQPDQRINAVFRHGLPHHLRIAASLYVRPGDVSSLAMLKLDLINTLRAVQKRFSDAQPFLEISTDEAAAEPPVPSERRTEDPAAQAEKTYVIIQPRGTAKRRRGNSPEGDATSGSVTNARTKRTRARRPNDTERIIRTRIRKLGEPEDPDSVTVKGEPSDAKGSNLYFLGPLMTAYSVFPYLFYFATNLPKPGPLAMNVATLPKQKLMTRIVNDTMRNYARSRTSQKLTDAVLGSSSDQDAMIPVDLDQDILKEPTQITKAKTLQESLAMVSAFWKQYQTMGVRQKILESWAIDIIYNAVGVGVGQTPDKPMLSKIKRAAQELMPVLKPAHMQGTNDQTIIRTQYYWKLLAEFRSHGLPFLVAYRTSTVDTALLLDGLSEAQQ